MAAAIVIGSGPNGLAAAIVLAQAGLSVEVREAAAVAGGAMQSGALTLTGFVHDLGSAVHPMAVSSPFFRSLPLADHGLSWIWPEASLAHPFDDGTAVTLERDVKATAAQLGGDAAAYRKLFGPFATNWFDLVADTLRPFGIPRHPLLAGRLVLRGLPSAKGIAHTLFRGPRARALFAGLCAHSTLALEAPLSSAFGLMLGAAGHAVGWPIPAGGAQRIADSLVSLLASLGGRVVMNRRVTSLADCGGDLTMCDVTPRQFIHLASDSLSESYRRSLARFRYGPGIFKVDFALREPIPWKASECRRAATVHLGATLDEIAMSERSVTHSRVAARPFVLLAQPSLFDTTRAPAGKHTAWAYCHVPNSWSGSALAALEAQIERFAPGFGECVLARAVHDPAQMQAWNENLNGGDLTGGTPDLWQFFARPTWRQYRTPIKSVYLCSSSTPPGGGVHGMCGYWAARAALE